MLSILFAKHVRFEHSVSSPRPAITSRRKENYSKAKVFQHPIDNHSQSGSSCLISPHFVAGAFGVGRGAASFLATENTGTVLIPRLMTRIASHGFEQLTPGQMGWLGAATVGSMPAFTLSHSEKSTNITSFSHRGAWRGHCFPEPFS